MLNEINKKVKKGNHAVVDNFDEDVQIHHLTDCVNLLSENMSIFNNNKNISIAT